MNSASAALKRRNRNFKGFASLGKKGLWRSARFEGDRRLVVGKSVIDPAGLLRASAKKAFKDVGLTKEEAQEAEAAVFNAWMKAARHGEHFFTPFGILTGFEEQDPRFPYGPPTLQVQMIPAVGGDGRAVFDDQTLIQ